MEEWNAESKHAMLVTLGMCSCVASMREMAEALCLCVRLGRYS